ncbi:MAG: hypothetical protein JW982_06455 [Spirochaetes bacterium]|nr:hypothetical protein [Spirochaetota bacterium]
MDFLEEKTPKGYTLKIFADKGNFIVFDRKGQSIYTEDEEASPIHKLETIVFYGKNFFISMRMQGEYALFKVSKNKIIIPYNYSGETGLHYLLLDTPELIDMIPLKIIKYDDILPLIRLIDSGIKPDLIIVDNTITENDVVLIKNRFSEVKLLVAEEKTQKKPIDVTLSDVTHQEADKVLSEINLNMMSQNPVYLARVHLKRMYFQKVKQLLLDFDLSAVDAGYVLTIIKALKKEYESDRKMHKNIPILDELIHDFTFFEAVISNDTEKIMNLIEEVNSLSQISSYTTLLAKAKSMTGNDSLEYIDFENKIYEKKENLQSGKIDLKSLKKAVSAIPDDFLQESEKEGESDIPEPGIKGNETEI